MRHLPQWALIAGLGLVGCDRPSVPEGLVPAAQAALVAPRVPLPAVEATPARVVAEPAAPAPTETSACPSSMVLVEGDYCPDVAHRCLEWADPPGRYEYFRCLEYAQPAVCKSKERRHVRYCIDRDEFTPEGESLPANFQSWTKGDKACRAQGKRMCLESEWNFACEGEEMRPYPYGFTRDESACNADHQEVVNKHGTLIDRRAPADAHPRCDSPFGVRNMAGNVEEFVTIDRSVPARPAMKGAYWQPSRNHCRAAQTAHDSYYNGMETGFRCCADAPPP